MSDLFDKFVFDLQRFDDVQFSQIGGASTDKYNWANSQKPLLVFGGESTSTLTVTLTSGEGDDQPSTITALGSVILDSSKVGYKIDSIGHALEGEDYDDQSVNVYYAIKSGSLALGDDNPVYYFEAPNNSAYFKVNNDLAATFDFTAKGAGLKSDPTNGLNSENLTYNNGGASFGSNFLMTGIDAWLRRTEQTEFTASGLSYDEASPGMVSFGDKVFQVTEGSGSAAVVFSVDNNGPLTFTKATVDADTAIQVRGMSGEDLAINGASVNVNVNYIFTRIGGGSGAIDLAGVSAPDDGIVVSHTGNAEQVRLGALTNANVTIGDTEFVATAGGSGFSFEVASDKATGVSGIDEAGESITGAFFKTAGFTFNGESVGLSAKDVNNTYTYSLHTLSGLIDGDSITGAGSISTFITKEISDGATFGVPGGSMSFVGDDTDGVEFNFNGGSFAGISGLNKDLSVEGDFTSGSILVNGQSLATTDDSLILYGMGESNADATGIGKIAGFTGGYSITDAGGASQIITDSEGLFKVGSQSFGTEGDSSITFMMGASTIVEGISGFGGGDVDATLTGALSTVWINKEDNNIDVNGDTDKAFTYMYRAEGSKYILGGVSGDNVTINGTGGAEIVQVTGSGSYTFNLAGGSSVTFNLALGGDSDGVEFLFDKNGNLVGISSFDKGDTITGDFSGSAIAIYGKNEEGEGASTSVQVDGDTYVVVNHDAFQLEKISNGAYIVQAEGISYAYTDALTANGSLSVKDASGDVFTITAGAAGGDSVMFVLDGNAEIVGVSGLTSDMTLLGSASVFENSFMVNGLSVVVKNDSDGIVGVIGSASGEEGVGIDAITNLSDSASVELAGSASYAYTDTEGTFTFTNAPSGITISGDSEVQFIFTDKNITAADVGGISQFEGWLTASASFFEDFTVNGQSINIVNDADDLAVQGISGGIGAISKVGPADNAHGASGVQVIDAGGASYITTDKPGGFSFATSGQEFQVYGDSSVDFVLNSESAVEAINGFAVDSESAAVVLGPLNGIAINGNSAIEVTVDGESAPNLAYASYGGAYYLSTYNTSGASSVAINNAGGASYFVTSNEGEFKFAGNSAFTVEGDSSVVFELVKGDPATAAGVSYLGVGSESGALANVGGAVSATITGELQDFTINNSSDSIAVTNDADDIFSYAVDDQGIGSGSHATLGGVSGSGLIEINGTGGASVVEITGGASYQFFGDKTFTYGSESGTFSGSDGVAQFVLNGTSVAAINSFNKGDTVSGDFTTAVLFNQSGSGLDQATVQVSGDSFISVIYDDIIIRNLSNGATFETVKGVGEAWTDIMTSSASSIEVTDTANNKFKVSGEDVDGVQFLVDKTTGAIYGVSSLDEDVTLAGSLDALSSINGRDFNIQGDDNFVVIGSESAQGIGAIYGLGSESGVTINNAGGASQIYTNKEGVFYFADNAAAPSGVTIADDAEVVFGLDTGASAAVLSIDSLSGFAAADNGLFDNLTVNGQSIAISGDEGMLAVMGTSAEDGIDAILNVGGSAVVINAMGGASYLVTDKVGEFTFASASQTITLAGDSIIQFTVNDKEVVQAIDGLSALGNVEADNTLFLGESAITVNGKVVDIDGDENTLKLWGKDDEDGITIIDNVGGSSTVSVNAVAGATTVRTDQNGDFYFATKGQSFYVEDTTDEVTDFLMDGSQSAFVTGIEGLSEGTIIFDTVTTALSVNTLEYAAQNMTFGTTSSVTLTVDPYQVVEVDGITAGGYVSGVVGNDDAATVWAEGPVTVNGKYVDITDDDKDYGIIVRSDSPDEQGTPEEAINVTGDATVNVDNFTVTADGNGDFWIGGESYEFTDNDDPTEFKFTTDPDKKLESVDSLNGTMVDYDGAVDLVDGFNGDPIVITDNTSPATLTGDNENLTRIDTLDSGAVITGNVSNADIIMGGDSEVGNSIPAVLTVNGNTYELYDDSDGITIRNAGVDGIGTIIGLDEATSLKVSTGGVYTVNDKPTVFSGQGDSPSVKAGDVIIGIEDTQSAYIYDANNPLIREKTPLDEIERITGIPSSDGYGQIGGQSTTTAHPTTGIPLNIAETNIIQGSLSAGEAATVYPYVTSRYNSSLDVDLDQPLEIWIDNKESPVNNNQDLDLSDNRYAKKVHMFKGTQSVEFNNDGGNLAHIESVASGHKTVDLGDGGDVVVMDEPSAVGNSVSIIGGLKNDSIFVRDSANTTVDVSAGGADKIITYANAGARVTVVGYEPSMEGGIKIDELQSTDMLAAIMGQSSGLNINFGDGVVSIEHTSYDKHSEISLGADANNATFVNLFDYQNNPVPVGFTGIDGGTLDVGSTENDPLILVGNYKGNKTAGSVILGGAGPDVVLAGGMDSVDARGGNNTVILENDAERDGAVIAFTQGRTDVYGMNNTLAASTGDTIVLSANNIKNFKFDGTDVTIDGNGFYGILENVDAEEGAEGKYVTQYIYNSDNSTVYKAAGAEANAVIYLPTDEDVRPNAFFGMNSGINFGNYADPQTVMIDLKGDMAESSIGGSPIYTRGITRLYGYYYDYSLGKHVATTENLIFKGSDANDTLVAGNGNTSLYGDGGKNLLVGSYDYDETLSDKEGRVTFFVIGNANGAANTISNFEYVSDNNYKDTSRVTADQIEILEEQSEVVYADVSNNDVYIEVASFGGENKESVVLQNAIDTVTGYGKDFIVSGNVAQVGKDKVLVDRFGEFYMATEKNATIDVKEEGSPVTVWLDNPETGKTFRGDFAVIDASTLTSNAQLAGRGNKENTIIGGYGNNSLWGGEGSSNDVLIGGEGKNTFFYGLGNGQDTIEANDGDEVVLGISIDDIVESQSSIGDTSLTLKLRDGGSLTVNDGGGIVDYKLTNSEGVQETYYLDSNRQFKQR